MGGTQWIWRGLRLLHLAGLAGAAGTLPALAAIGIGDHPGLAADLVYGVMLPGLGLAVASGVALTWVRRLDPRRHRWVVLHAGLACVAVGLAAGLVAPAFDLMATLAEIHGGDMGMPAYAALADRAWAGSGLGVVVILCLIAAATAKWPGPPRDATPLPRTLTSPREGA
jgi:hypothetical protein